MHSELHIEIEQKILPNGLRIVVAPNHKAPVVTIAVAYKVGSKNENPDKTGFAHLFEHLMFEGSKNVPKGMFDKFCSGAGGTNNAYTTYDYTMYYMTLPSHQLEMALWLESDRMLQFSVTEEALSTQQKVVTEEISQTVENQPYARWRLAQAQAAFTPDCSYSWEVYGSKQHVADATLDDTRNFYEKFYRPNNACIVLSGDVSPEEGFRLAEKFFGEIPPAKEKIILQPCSAEQRKGNNHTSIQDTVPLNAVFLSYHTDGYASDDLFAADILSSILSDGRSSRFYSSLVYERQMASSVGSYVDKREGGSLFTCYAIASMPDISCDELAVAIEDELKKILSDGISEKEMTKSQNALKTQLAYDLQQTSGIADAIAHQTLFWDDPSRVNTLLDKYSQYDKIYIHSFAEKLFRNENKVRTDVIAQGNSTEENSDNS